MWTYSTTQQAHAALAGWLAEAHFSGQIIQIGCRCEFGLNRNGNSPKWHHRVVSANRGKQREWSCWKKKTTKKQNILPTLTRLLSLTLCKKDSFLIEQEKKIVCSWQHWWGFQVEPGLPWQTVSELWVNYFFLLFFIALWEFQQHGKPATFSAK